MRKLLLIILSACLLLFVSYAIANVDAPDKEFTAKTLAEFDGANGAKAYIAIEGIVYDVSLIKAWKGGKHKMGLTAGKDLSDWIEKSPHGKTVLKTLPKVGKFTE